MSFPRGLGETSGKEHAVERQHKYSSEKPEAAHLFSQDSDLERSFRCLERGGARSGQRETPGVEREGGITSASKVVLRKRN
jgi:hypothetical protein